MIPGNDAVENIISIILKGVKLIGTPSEVEIREAMEVDFNERLGKTIFENLNDKGQKEYIKLFNKKSKVESDKLEELIKKYCRAESILQIDIKECIDDFSIEYMDRLIHMQSENKNKSEIKIGESRQTVKNEQVDYIKSAIEIIIKESGFENMPDDFKQEYAQKLPQFAVVLLANLLS